MLGEQIQTLREARGITQTELGKQLGVSKQSVSNWEHNNILPSTELIIKMAHFFSCSTDYLLGLDNTANYIDISGLSDKQFALVASLIDEFRHSNI